MREGMGKYRGKAKSGYYKGEWFYGSLVIAEAFIKHKPKQHMPTWIVTSAFGNGGWFNIRNRVCVDPATVGQFTGLKDKNGVDIYEGDYLRGDSTTYKVDCGKDMLDFKISGCQDGWRIRQRLSFANQAERLEVTGNIHDNPELIKEQ